MTSHSFLAEVKRLNLREGVSLITQCEEDLREERLREERRQNLHPPVPRLCQRCLVRPVQVVAWPCGHLVCLHCVLAAGVHHCPVCGQRVFLLVPY